AISKQPKRNGVLEPDIHQQRVRNMLRGYPELLHPRLLQPLDWVRLQQQRQLGQTAG
ncbi:unnamed protein product, partial [Allacma fusca]